MLFCFREFSNLTHLKCVSCHLKNKMLLFITHYTAQIQIGDSGLYSCESIDCMDEHRMLAGIWRFWVRGVIMGNTFSCVLMFWNMTIKLPIITFKGKCPATKASPKRKLISLCWMNRNTTSQYTASKIKLV